MGGWADGCMMGRKIWMNSLIKKPSELGVVAHRNPRIWGKEVGRLLASGPTGLHLVLENAWGSFNNIFKCWQRI